MLEGIKPKASFDLFSDVPSVLQNESAQAYFAARSSPHSASLDDVDGKTADSMASTSPEIQQAQDLVRIRRAPPLILKRVIMTDLPDMRRDVVSYYKEREVAKKHIRPGTKLDTGADVTAGHDSGLTGQLRTFGAGISKSVAQGVTKVQAIVEDINSAWDPEVQLAREAAQSRENAETAALDALAASESEPVENDAEAGVADKETPTETVVENTNAPSLADMPTQELEKVGNAEPLHSSTTSDAKNTISSAVPVAPMEDVFELQGPSSSAQTEEVCGNMAEKTAIRDAQRASGCRPQLQIFVAGTLVWSSATEQQVKEVQSAWKTTASSHSLPKSKDSNEQQKSISAPAAEPVAAAEAFRSEQASEATPSSSTLEWCPSNEAVRFAVDIPVSGDILVRCRHVADDRPRETFFRAAFHTGYIPGSVLRFTSKKLDVALRDPRLANEFTVEFFFEPMLVDATADATSKTIQEIELEPMASPASLPDLVKLTAEEVEAELFSPALWSAISQRKLLHSLLRSDSSESKLTGRGSRAGSVSVDSAAATARPTLISPPVTGTYSAMSARGKPASPDSVTSTGNASIVASESTTLISPDSATIGNATNESRNENGGKAEPASRRFGSLMSSFAKGAVTSARKAALAVAEEARLTAKEVEELSKEMARDLSRYKDEVLHPGGPSTASGGPTVPERALPRAQIRSSGAAAARLSQELASTAAAATSGEEKAQVAGAAVSTMESKQEGRAVSGSMDSIQSSASTSTSGTAATSAPDQAGLPSNISQKLGRFTRFFKEPPPPTTNVPPASAAAPAKSAPAAATPARGKISSVRLGTDVNSTLAASLEADLAALEAFERQLQESTETRTKPPATASAASTTSASVPPPSLPAAKVSPVQSTIDSGSVTATTSSTTSAPATEDSIPAHEEVSYAVQHMAAEELTVESESRFTGKSSEPVAAIVEPDSALVADAIPSDEIKDTSTAEVVELVEFMAPATIEAIDVQTPEVEESISASVPSPSEETPMSAPSNSSTAATTPAKALEASSDPFLSDVMQLLSTDADIEAELDTFLEADTNKSVGAYQQELDELDDLEAFIDSLN